MCLRPAGDSSGDGASGIRRIGRTRVLSPVVSAPPSHCCCCCCCCLYATTSSALALRSFGGDRTEGCVAASFLFPPPSSPPSLSPPSPPSPPSSSSSPFASTALRCRSRSSRRSRATCAADFRWCPPPPATTAAPLTLPPMLRPMLLMLPPLLPPTCPWLRRRAFACAAAINRSRAPSGCGCPSSSSDTWCTRRSVARCLPWPPLLSLVLSRAPVATVVAACGRCVAVAAGDKRFACVPVKLTAVAVLTFRLGGPLPPPPPPAPLLFVGVEALLRCTRRRDVRAGTGDSRKSSVDVDILVLLPLLLLRRNSFPSS